FARIAEATDNPDGTVVIIDQPKIVTGVFGSVFYIQEPDRTRGLRIESNASVALGDLVRVAGRLAVSDGERCLRDAEVVKQGSGAAPKPVALRISDIGGSAPDSYTPSIGGTGAYNIGLLVRTMGRVTARGSGWFEITDGSGAVAKVLSSLVLEPGTFVAVTGVASTEASQRLVRTINPSDVTVY
ncbi:MAG: hypothetical protein QHI38_07855, partial [Armatimonadota bacterium]|nr:hypothetical protein [Armatimonadota bacterium]